MNLTERERAILQLARRGLSDYRIGRKINTDPPSVTRSRKNAHMKLLNAISDLDWATKIGVSVPQLLLDMDNRITNSYSFFL